MEAVDGSMDLWHSDGTTAGNLALAALRERYSSVQLFATAGSTVFLQSYDFTTQSRALWAVDLAQLP
ncbi:hypothetical protein HC891_13665 [Candidatus Gracilibacteria bacterium]|nr:hypothetical protein [Candidatus Gracilibacteria bacterium]